MNIIIIGLVGVPTLAILIAISGTYFNKSVDRREKLKKLKDKRY